MVKIKELLHANLLTFCIILFGVGLRLLVATRGHNVDFESFLIAARIVESGGDVYISTTRYNYGPIWFNILWILYKLASQDPLFFRYLLVTLLSLVDLFIFYILYKKLNKTAAYLFFLNPISIIITGYHNQFDNLALSLGILAIVIMGDNFEKPLDKNKLLGLLILGISITTKHILFVFPFWLAVKQKGRFSKIAMVFIPIIIFAISFIPYWHSGSKGIIQNVFLYESHNNAIFYNLFVPPIFQFFLTSKIIWIFFLITFALVFRKKSGFDSLLLYTCILISTSPSIANQYLVIAMPFIIANINPYTISYMIFGTLFLLTDSNGLHLFFELPPDTDTAGMFASAALAVLGVLLLLGLIRSLWYESIQSLARKILEEIKIQISRE